MGLPREQLFALAGAAVPMSMETVDYGESVDRAILGTDRSVILTVQVPAKMVERARQRAAWRAIIDEAWPERGPCGICGSHADARHRLFDTIVGRHLYGGESISALAEDYAKPRQAIVAVLRFDEAGALGKAWCRKLEKKRATRRRRKLRGWR